MKKIILDCFQIDLKYLKGKKIIATRVLVPLDSKEDSRVRLIFQFESMVNELLKNIPPSQG